MKTRTASWLDEAVANYNPDEDYNGGYGHCLADLVLKRKEIERFGERAELEINLEFIKKADRLKVDDVFSYREEKQRLIKKYSGYTKLNGSNSLEECSNEQIGNAFKQIYYSTLKKIKNYAGAGR